MTEIMTTNKPQELTAEIFNRELDRAESICILGHISPDGDCVGSVLGVWNYILARRPEDSLTVQVYLEDVNSKFAYLPGSDRISADPKENRSYDLAVVCDCADAGRLGRFGRYLEEARVSVVLDHHITNEGFGDYCLVRPKASSASEVLFELLEPEYFNKAQAECIYTGLVHDTGVFRHNSTSRRTMEIAGRCMDEGIDFNGIIEESFFAMSLEQKRVLGYLLTNMQSRAGGRMICGWTDMNVLKSLGAESVDMDGMIDQMRTTTGAVMALFMHETKDGRIKASLRSNSDAADVSKIAMLYGGGGHKRAAGCFMSKDFEKNAELVEAEVLRQLEEYENTVTLGSR